MPSTKGKHFAPVPLTESEVQRLIAASAGKGPIATRNRALIVLLWRTGLRVSEALALYPHDIDTKAGTVTVREGKGGTHRVVVIIGGSAALDYLHAWNELRGRMGINGRNPTFCSVGGHGKRSKGVRKPGRPINPAYVRALLPRLAEKAGIDKRVHAHGLRHTHAADMANAERPVSLSMIASQLGHASVATTDRYLQKLTPRDLVAAIRKSGL